MNESMDGERIVYWSAILARASTLDELKGAWAELTISGGLWMSLSRKAPHVGENQAAAFTGMESALSALPGKGADK